MSSFKAAQTTPLIAANDSTSVPSLFSASFPTLSLSLSLRNYLYIHLSLFQFPIFFHAASEEMSSSTTRGVVQRGMFPAYFDGSLADRRFLIFLSRASYELSLRIVARGRAR